MNNRSNRKNGLINDQKKKRKRYKRNRDYGNYNNTSQRQDNYNLNNNTSNTVFLRNFLQQEKQNINGIDVQRLEKQLKKQKLEKLRLDDMHEFILTSKTLQNYPSKFDNFLVILKDHEFFYQEIWTIFQKEIQFYKIQQNRTKFDESFEIFDGFIDIYINQFERIPMQSLKLDISIMQILVPQFQDLGKKYYSFVITQQEQVKQENIKNLDQKLRRLIDIVNINKQRYQNQPVVNTTQYQKKQDKKQYQFRDDISQLNIMPDIDDIMQRDVELQPHRIDEPYQNYQEYKNVTFRLLKEELCSSLRDQLNEYQLQEQGKSKFQRKICTNAKLVNIILDKRMVGVELEIYRKFKPKFSWNRTRKFMNGNLLMISPDKFKSFFFGIVRGRDSRKMDMTTKKFGYARIVLELKDDQLSQCEIYQQNTGIDLLVIESSVFYQLFFYTMQFLKQSQHLSLEGQLIQCYQQKDMELYNNNRPDYVQNDPYVRSIIKNSLNSQRFTLDQSQRQAIEQTFENNIAMIQGPPGTGKSYTGIIMAKTLLQIQKQNPSTFGPIMLVCFTNHALDQFLEHIVDFDQNVIRLGGSSKNQNLEQYSLVNISRKYKYKFGKALYSRFRERDELLQRADYLLNLIPFPFFDNNTLNSLDEADKQDFEKPYNDFMNVLNQQKNILFNHFRFQSYDENSQLWQNYQDYLFDQTEGIGYQNLSILFYLWLFDPSVITQKFIDMFQEILNIQKQEQRIDEEEEMNLDRAFEELEKQKQENQHKQNIKIKQNKYAKYYIFLQKKIITNDKENMQYNYSEYFEYYNQQYNVSDLKVDQQIKRDYKNFEYKDTYRLYYHLHMYYNEHLKDRQQQLTEVSKDLQSLVEEIDLLHQERDRQLLLGASFIAMTTYGALKYKNILNEIQSTVMIVEEAAEVLDCQIITSLTQTTQHVILIGDHKQLRPKVNDMQLISKYNFDVSLFERLINCNFKQVTLDTQRRMRPEIANITRLTYPNLKDGSQTQNRQSVDQIGNLFFFTHEWPENSDEFSQSKINKKEADFIIAFAELLLKNNLKPEQITILSLYAGQLLLIKRLMLSQKQLQNIRIATVDDFQGEENDVIILSLVRSNKDGNIGFLKNNNRLNVALSRARNQLYIFGNAQTIRDFSMSQKQDKDDVLWIKVLKHFSEKKLIIEKIELKCLRHGALINIRELQDFQKAPEGGCRQLCKVRKNCGHSCKRFCHNYNITSSDTDGHKQDKCTDICDKFHNCEHQCKKLCYICQEDSQKKCMKKVDYFKQECLHTIEIFCHQKYDQNIFCTAQCTKFLKCWHLCQKKCGEICTEIKQSDIQLGYNSCCREMVEIESSCGHQVKVPCKDLKNPLIKNYHVNCKQKCEKKLSCDHKCDGRCSDCNKTFEIFDLGFHAGYCNEKCQRNLPCNHVCQDLCSHQSCSSCKKECSTNCLHSNCPKKCGDICQNCEEPCKYKCFHLQCSKKCYEICDREPCNERCQEQLKCSHQCIGLCGEICPIICKECDKDHEDFKIFFGFEDDEDAKFLMLDCGHNIESKAMDMYTQNISQSENQNQKEVKKLECPKCKQQVNKCMRYQKIIKKINQQFNQLKQQNIDKIKQFEEEYKQNIQFIKDIQISFNQYKYPDQKLKKYFIQLNSKEYEKDKFKHEQLSQILYRTNIIKKYLEIFQYLKNPQNYTISYGSSSTIQQFIKDTGYFIYLSQLPFIKENINNLKLILRGIDMYYRNYEKTQRLTLLDKKMILQKQLEYIKEQKYILNDITFQEFKDIFDYEYEMEEIKQVLSVFGRGHTFQCTKCGYLYVITECGGAMQQFKCPGNNGKCDNMLGGGGHRLNQNNRHVGQFDNTVRNAYEQLVIDNPIPQHLLQNQ